jgi:Tol biopolymer transport system component
MRKPVLASTVAALLWMAPSFATPTDTPLDVAALAWDRGDYISALTTYLQVLDSPQGDEALETIALQTGELYRTTELTMDGAEPSFSPDGRFIAYETGPAPARTTRLVASSDPLKPLAELPGSRGVFSPDSTRFAYLKHPATQEFQRAVSALNDENNPQPRAQRLAAVNTQLANDSQVVVRDLASGRESIIDVGSLRKTGLAFTAQSVLLAGSQNDQPGQLYALREGAAPTALTTGAGDKTIGVLNRQGTAVTFTSRGGGGRGGGRGAGGRGGGGAAGGGPQFSLLRLDGSAPVAVSGSAPTFSAEGSTLAFIGRAGAEYRLILAPVADPTKETVVHDGTERIDAPAFSPDGKRLAFQMMAKEDWEIYTADIGGKEPQRVTREIQHDLLPRFVGPDTLLGMIGEARHRRSHLHDLRTGTRTRVFHNNTVRTIAPEYEWVPSDDGSRMLIVAERDGDTVSVERGVYLVDLKARITKDDLRARLRSNLASEQALRAKAERIFKPIAAEVRRVVADASVARVYRYEKALFDFDSKHISQPGNRKAIQYLFDTYRSFGYQPERQEFEAQQRGGGGAIKTANVLATLEGTVNPELVYVVSSHFDSVAGGPGADDDTSGTAALLEAARILAKHPQPATIVFASFTGEEAGLLGSREYVRQAVANNVRLVGALNNDMIGWANDHRLDNTIRYSNAGIRDIQHGAAMQFTNLITYDALYYKSTDAAAYYEAYGDIVGGIGSYPVLGNPHYHQAHDLLDTINHQLVTEVAKTTAATLMMLASSPSRLADLKIDRMNGGAAQVSWTASPERAVTEYLVTYGPANNPEARQMRVKGTTASVPGAAAGTVIQVKAINAKGLEGWDWARVVVK